MDCARDYGGNKACWIPVVQIEAVKLFHGYIWCCCAIRVSEDVSCALHDRALGISYSGVRDTVVY